MEKQFFPVTKRLGFYWLTMLIHYSYRGLVLCFIFVIGFIPEISISQVSFDALLLDMENIGVDQGISAGMIYQVAEDHKGYLWLATSQGLNRYDGYEVKSYQHIPNDSLSLPDNHITEVFVDSRGWLWLSTINAGLLLFDYETESFISMGFEVQWFMKEDQWNNLWVYEFNIGWRVITLSQDWNENVDFQQIKEYLSVQKAEDVFQGLPKHFPIRQTMLSKENGLWFEYQDSLFAYNLDFDNHSASLRFQRKIKPRKNYDRSSYSRILEDQHHEVYCIGDEAYHTIHPSTGDFLTTHSFPPKQRQYNLIPYLIDSKKRMWARAGNNNELFLLDFSENRLSNVIKTGVESTLPNWGLSPNHLINGKNDNIWIASRGYGVYKYTASSERFQYYGNNHVGPSFCPFFVLPNNKILLKEWVQILDINKKELYGFSKDEKLTPFISKDMYPKVFLGADSTIWLYISDKAILHQYDNEGMSSQSYDLDSLLEHQPTLYSDAFFDRNNILNIIYIISDNVELKKEGDLLLFQCNGFNKKETRKYIFKSPKDRTDFHELRYQTQTPDGKIWLAMSEGGIVTFDPLTETFEHFVNKEDDPNSISSSRTLCLYPDPLAPDSIMWIGTSNGLNKMDIQSKTFEYYTTKDGLPNDVIYGILSDDYHNLWLSTNKGLCLFNPNTLQTRNFTKKDGLQHNEFNKGAFAKMDNGQMFFGGVGGLTWFDPNDFYQEQSTSNVVINGIRLTNKKTPYSRPLGDTSLFLNKPVEYSSQIVLPHDERMITFEFATLDLTNPNKNLYRYKLEGFNTDWVDAKAQHEATFTNLSPGNYIFKVQGLNSHNVWNENGASIQLKVLTPWWATWWFRLLVTSIVAGIIYSFYRTKQKEKERVEALRNRISADLHDEIGSTLSSISLFSTVARKGMKAEGGMMVDMLDRINKSSTEVMESMNDIVWAIRSDNDKFEDVINRMRAFTSELVEATDWSIEFEYHETLPELNLSMIQRRNIYLIFKEAVNNAIKYSGGENLIIRFYKKGKTLSLEIEDDGKGFEQTAKAEQFSLGGNGLKNMKKRADELLGMLEINSVIDKGTIIIMHCDL